MFRTQRERRLANNSFVHPALHIWIFMMKLENTARRCRQRDITSPKTETVDCWLFSREGAHEKILHLAAVDGIIKTQWEGILLFMVMSEPSGLAGWCKVKPGRPEIFHFYCAFVSWLSFAVNGPWFRVRRRLHSIKDSPTTGNWPLSFFSCLKSQKFHNAGLYTPINYKRATLSR